MRGRGEFWTGIVLSLLVSGAVASTPKSLDADDRFPPALTSQQRARVQELISEFRRKREQPEDQDKVVDEILEIGGPAVNQLMSVVNKELSGKLKPYGGKFQQQAVELSRAKLQGIDIQAIRQLQEKVLALRKRDNLSKEMIQREADPVLKKLRDLVVVNRKAILNRSSSLQEERGQLLMVGRHWQRCVEHMIEQLPPNNESPPEKPSFDAYLRGEEELLAQLAAPMSPGARAVLAVNNRLANRVDREEARSILACNLTRNLLGLAPLTIDLALTAAARDHSSDMKTHKFFSHTSPVPGKSSPGDRARNFNASWSAENIFMGSTDGTVAHRAWFHSPGHHRNLLGDHRRVGVGRHGVYFTQMFGR